MKYSDIIKNDFSAAPGVCVTFFEQGCPHRCPECHNPETWDFLAGKEFTNDVLKELLDAIAANNIKRNLCIMGGEPMCKENEFLTYLVIQTVKEKYPDVKIFIWTGYTLEELLQKGFNKTKDILKLCDGLVDGRYEKELRDTTLKMRGSSNQKIYDKEDLQKYFLEGE